ncbi:MAG: type II secretion system protein H [Saprospiraceae bacterium]|jgi:type II secretion system protein H
MKFRNSNRTALRAQPDTAAPAEKGFTLIEIMVAVFIMVIATSFMVANIGQSSGRVLRQEARTIATMINHGLDEAVLTGQVLGVQIDSSKQTYQFINIGSGLALAADSEGEKDSFMRLRTLPEGVSINLDLTKRKKKNQSTFTPSRVSEVLNSSILDKASNVFDDDSRPRNAVVMEPNGLITPFTLMLQADKESVIIKLSDAGFAVVVDPKNKG